MKYLERGSSNGFAVKIMCPAKCFWKMVFPIVYAKTLSILIRNDKLTRAINPLEEIETKPFYSNDSRQMKLVSDFGWIPFEELRHLKDDIREIFVPTEFIDEERIEALANAVTGRVEELQDMEMEQKKQYTLGNLQQ